MSKKKAMFFKQVDAGVTNLYSWSDAASPIPNEIETVVLSTTNGWESVQGLDPIVPSDIEFQGGGASGLYSIELKSSSAGGSDFAKVWFTVETGKSYRFTFWAKTDANGDGDSRLRSSEGWVTNPTETTFTTTWTEYSFDVEATGTLGSFLFWTTRSGATLNTMWLDNITMIEI